MLFEDPRKRYPFLSQALAELGRRRFDVEDRRTEWLKLVTLGTLIAGVSGGLAGSTGALLFLPWGACLGFVWLLRSRRPKPMVNERAREATAVAQTMGLMLQKRRLHRDLDPGSLILLEECARHWHRARAALDGPFWTHGMVPEYYRQVRHKALVSLDESMDEVLLHYRAWLPDAVRSRHPFDYVDEAMESVMGRRSAAGNFPPPAFGPVRIIADKLMELANETERLSQEARLDPEVAAAATPGRSLDQTLSELRSMREAEAELRQNLRG